MTNCPNCGAAITGAKCEYCGTRFFTPDTSTFELNGDILTIMCGNKPIKAYMSDCSIQRQTVYTGEVGRDRMGRLHYDGKFNKHKINIEFVEI